MKDLNHFTDVWKRLKVTVWAPLPWSRYANTTWNHDKVSIYCALLTSHESKVSGLPLCKLGNFILWNAAYHEGKTENFRQCWSPLKQKMLISLCANSCVCPSGAQRFCKNDSDSNLESLTVTRVILWKTWLESCRVTIFLNVTRVVSESPKYVTRVESFTPALPVLLLLQNELQAPRCFVLTLCGIVLFYSGCYKVHLTPR